MTLRIKICGITKPEQGRAIAQLGATALGFICAEQSPRYVSPEQIGAIVAHLPMDATTGVPIVDRVGVFVNATPEVIQQTVTIGHLNVVQLHGSESPEFCQQLRQHLPRIELIKALRIRAIEDCTQASRYQSCVDTLLLDAYDPKLAGGTGKTIDWQLLQQFQPECPWLLAGGLTPENVLVALQQVTPNGIDLSSGVERSPGDKDLQLVEKLFEQLQLNAIAGVVHATTPN
ncbi:phosphoribosylanthranilate isomerase [Pantanalinema sp. GBBB05]|uniref:phosphoribosylanthranilate isomerase n=1 Tax=Pantanalinema sp. GBBB05 TaxID=2604139 RepID=UPI001DA71505|nr:phosphoribosylanthranilate isomerase [Pantanalinema sp. GBBB05]